MFSEAQYAKDNFAKHKQFKVGAYLMTDESEFYAGNVEHTNSRLTLCAEMLVLAQCKSQGLTPRHLYVTSDSAKPIFPCGVCRQYASEFPKLKVTSYNNDGTRQVTKTISQLFPNPFQRN
jgi:cytidine deaminase